MPITFLMNHNEGYFEVQYKGAISDTELLNAWRSFLNSDDWIPGSNGLADLSEAGLSTVSVNGLRALADYISYIYRKNGITSTKTAIYTPLPVPFGLSRMYEVFADKFLENVMVFKDREKAKQWLRKGK